MNSNVELAVALSKQNESGKSHGEYESELNFYSAVQAGDLEKVKRLYTPINTETMGVLSTNPTRNFRYHFIISTAFITRFCMERGMPSEAAYTLSDLYIRKADTLSSNESLSQLHKDMIFDFTKRMKNLQKKGILSKPVRSAIEFIHQGIRNPIKAYDITNHLGMNAAYLSSLFKQETGISMNSYIQKVRIEEAENLLKYSNESFVEISEELCFSSQSHFISVFRKFRGMTPREYRKKYYNNKWTVDNS